MLTLLYLAKVEHVVGRWRVDVGIVCTLRHFSAICVFKKLFQLFSRQRFLEFSLKNAIVAVRQQCTWFSTTSVDYWGKCANKNSFFTQLRAVTTRVNIKMIFLAAHEKKIFVLIFAQERISLSRGNSQCGNVHENEQPLVWINSICATNAFYCSILICFDTFLFPSSINLNWNIVAC